MSTYQVLRDRALRLTDTLGQEEAESVAELALEECMKFVAFHVRIPSLIQSATFTALASPELEANAIALGASGFNITSTYQCPDRLYVQGDSTDPNAGVPYECLEYDIFVDLKGIPSIQRHALDPAIWDERPQYSYCITPNDTVWIQPLSEGDVVTLRYRVAPAALVLANTPEILPMFDYILQTGAEIVLKEWLREGEEISSMWGLFQAGLKDEVERYDSFLQSQRRRTHIKVHRSYRPH